MNDTSLETSDSRPDSDCRPFSKLMLIETDVEPVDATGDDCVICLAPLIESCVRTRCNHYFHQECLEEYLLTKRKERSCDRFARPQIRCPMCRTSLRRPCAVESRASSGLRIQVVGMPTVGDSCHFDRGYVFESMGGFDQPGMLYVITCNDDRKTPSSQVMWSLDTSISTNIYLNFRSEAHASRAPGVIAWLRRSGWKKNTTMESTVTSGYPNGPYSGPVFMRTCEPGTIELMGSNTWEGVYFVFVEPLEKCPATVGQPVHYFVPPPSVQGSLTTVTSDFQLLGLTQRRLAPATFSRITRHRHTQPAFARGDPWIDDADGAGSDADEASSEGSAAFGPSAIVRTSRQAAMLTPNPRSSPRTLPDEVIIRLARYSTNPSRRPGPRSLSPVAMPDVLVDNVTSVASTPTAPRRREAPLREVSTNQSAPEPSNGQQRRRGFRFRWPFRIPFFRRS